MKHATCVIVFVAFLASACAAEDHPAAPDSTDCFYFECLGNGMLGSLNYEHMTAKGLALRIGGVPFGGGGSALAMIGFRNGKRWLHLDGGVGVLFVFGASEMRHALDELSGMSFRGDAPLIVPTAALGLRIQPQRGGFLLRLTFTPIMGKGGQSFLPWVGLSIGIALPKRSAPARAI